MNIQTPVEDPNTRLERIAPKNYGIWETDNRKNKINDKYQEISREIDRLEGKYICTDEFSDLTRLVRELKYLKISNQLPISNRNQEIMKHIFSDIWYDGDAAIPRSLDDKFKYLFQCRREMDDSILRDLKRKLELIDASGNKDSIYNSKQKSDLLESVIWDLYGVNMENNSRMQAQISIYPVY